MTWDVQLSILERIIPLSTLHFYSFFFYLCKDLTGCLSWLQCCFKFYLYHSFVFPGGWILIYIYWRALPTFICQHLLSFGSEQLDPWKLSKKMGRKRNGGVALIKGGVVSVWVCTRESRLIKTPSLVLKAPPEQLVKHYEFLCESRC